MPTRLPHQDIFRGTPTACLGNFVEISSKELSHPFRMTSLRFPPRYSHEIWVKFPKLRVTTSDELGPSESLKLNPRNGSYELELSPLGSYVIMGHMNSLMMLSLLR